MDFKDRRFYAPFRCLCCGTEVDIKQFCYGRCCGLCDMGVCQYAKGHFHDMRYYIGYWSGHGRKDIFAEAQMIVQANGISQ